MKCSLCRKSVRSTTTVHVQEGRKLVCRRVCAGCAADGVTIVSGAASGAALCACGEQALWCAVCSATALARADARKILRSVIMRLEGFARGHRKSGSPDLAAVYEQASEAVTAEVKRL